MLNRDSTLTFASVQDKKPKLGNSSVDSGDTSHTKADYSELSQECARECVPANLYTCRIDDDERERL